MYQSGPGPIPPSSNLSTATVTPNGGTAQSLAYLTSGVRQFFSPFNYGAITDGGTFGDGVSHPASANGFSTLGALQNQFRAATFTATGSGTSLTISSVVGSVYPGQTLTVQTGISAGTKIVGRISGGFGTDGVYQTSATTTVSAASCSSSWASATSNDMAGLMIQAGIHAAHLAGPEFGGGGDIYLAQGHYYSLPQGFVMPYGTGATLRMAPAACILGSVCGTTAAFSIYNQSGCDCPVTGGQVWGFDSKSFGSVPGDGTANSGIFTSGTAAFEFYECNSIVIRNVLIQNFDQTARYNAIGGNYMIAWRDCAMILNNKAFSIDDPGATNSYERMSYENCLAGSCNIGAYINFATLGGPLAADAYMINCSIDYSCVLQVSYNNGNFFDLLSSVFMIGCHIETASTTSGSGSRIQIAGVISLLGCYWFENGSNPTGLIEYFDIQSAVSVVGCQNGCFSGSDASAVPWVVNFNPNVRGSANSGRGAGYVSLLYKTSDGALNSATQSGCQFGDTFTLAFVYNWDTPITLTATGTVTIPDFATTPFVKGINFTFNLAPGVTTTFAPLNGSVTLTSSGIGLTAIGPGTVFAFQHSQDNWSLTGKMT